MKRAIILQTEATNSKKKELKRFTKKALETANWLLSQREGCTTASDFQKKVYLPCKRNTNFQAQTICILIRAVWRKKGEGINAIQIPFDTPRNCKAFSTKTLDFVELRPYPRKRIAVPIKRNRNYQRFHSLLADGWICKTYGLTPKLEIVAYLSKDKDVPLRKNVLGIDLNAKRIAVSITTPSGKVLKQLYYGLDVWTRRKKIMARRSKLQSVNALGKLKRLKHKERDFVKTRLSQIVKEITALALKHDAEIAIEKLTRFNPKSKSFNKAAMRMPFFKFKQVLEQRCFDHDIPLSIVDAYHTSKWCSNCGAVGKGHCVSNYTLFKCRECGFVVNSDRKASLAVAVKCLLARSRDNQVLNQPDFVQIANRRVSVSGLYRSNGEDLGIDAVHFSQPSRNAHDFSRG